MARRVEGRGEPHKNVWRNKCQYYGTSKTERKNTQLMIVGLPNNYVYIRTTFIGNKYLRYLSIGFNYWTQLVPGFRHVTGGGS